MQTETLDKLYLEWSQLTTARTGREIAYRDKLRELLPLVGHHQRRLIEAVLNNFND